MIKNIVFDMGMVLLMYDPMQACHRHTGDKDKAATVYNAIFRSPEWILQDEGIATADEVLKAAQNRLETPELKTLAADVMHDWYLDSLWPKQGMEELLMELLSRGYRLYILSNAGLSFRSYEYKIPHLDKFSGVLVSAEEKLLKPDPAIFHRLCEKFSLNAEECAFIDDVPANVRGAQSVGMKGYCFADGDVDKLRVFMNAL